MKNKRENNNNIYDIVTVKEANRNLTLYKSVAYKYNNKLYAYKNQKSLDYSLRWNVLLFNSGNIPNLKIIDVN